MQLSNKISTPIIIFLISGLSLAAYLLASQVLYRVGFPLDDAWIHQTYARNLALFGEFSFIPGQPSAGSTSPLWTALLAVGYALRLPYLAWTFFLGWLVLGCISLAGIRLFSQLTGHDTPGKIWVGVFLALEWHLVWAAGSGMETLLYSLLILWVLGRVSLQPNGGFLTGCLIGVSLWVRPDGLLLLGPALWGHFWGSSDWRKRAKEVLKTVLGMIIFLAPYLWFNFQLSGSLWPNTFFAKQTEYALLTQTPLAQRLWQQFQLPLVGAGAALLPGMILAVLEVTRRRQWINLAGVLWGIGVMGIYAWRLPVIYQHGRYLIPVMPVFFVYGMVGYFLMYRKNSDLAIRRIITRAWGLAILTVQVIFLYLGGKAYALDAAFIESEMVESARWVEQNTGVQEIIAAHDIGALGYFANREIVDLAGLISPEVIPLMRDEIQLSHFLSLKAVDYLVTFPGWYPHLTNRAERIYSTSENFSIQLGGENMAVFRWTPK